MSEELNKLYDSVIREHYAHPYHFEKRKDFHPLIKSNNPVCGDRYEFYVEIKDDKIQSVYFHGFGCAVSMASASVLSKTLEGKTIQEVRDICDLFLKTINGAEQNQFAEFNSFAAVKNFPARYECAALAWNEMKKFLNK
jgi:nitrogen fixation NifU-like protein